MAAIRYQTTARSGSRRSGKQPRSQPAREAARGHGGAHRGREGRSRSAAAEVAALQRMARRSRSIQHTRRRLRGNQRKADRRFQVLDPACFQQARRERSSVCMQNN